MVREPHLVDNNRKNIDMNIFQRAYRAFFPPKGSTSSNIFSFDSSPIGFSENPTALACEDMIASQLGNLPLKLKAFVKGGGEVVASFHPLFPLLDRAPNSEDTPTEFLITLVRHIVRYGNGYVKIERVGNQVVALYLVSPRDVTVTRDTNNRLVYTLSNGLSYTSKDILHFRYPTTFNGTISQSPRDIASEIIALDNALLSYMRNYFGNSLGSRLSLTSTDKSDSKQTLEDYYKVIVPISNKLLESANAGKLLLPPPGSKFDSISQPTNAESELHSLKQLTERLIAQAYRVPYSLLDERESKYNSLEAKMGDFRTNCLKPLADVIEERFNNLIPISDTNLKYAFDWEYLTITDVKTRDDILMNRVSNGLMTLNEARAQVGLNSIGEDGDVHRLYMSAYLPLTVETDQALLASAKMKIQEAQKTTDGEHSPNGDNLLG